MSPSKMSAAVLVILLAWGWASGVNAQALATCTAPCGDGINTVSCSATTCQAHTNYVVCNGQSYHCPGCYAYCWNDPEVYCYSHSNQCASWFDNPTFTYWLSCSGVPQQCPDCGRPWCY
jgi:hypothetical protein